MSNAGILSSVAVYGAVGDGVTDDTEAIQTAIDLSPAGATVMFPTGTYKITAALSITGDITLRGAGVGSVAGTEAQSEGSGPLTAPYLTGSVLMPSTAGQNAIEITGTGKSVNLRDFGIRFADAIMFVDTGHGVYCANPTVASVGHELSTWDALWENVRIFGHDGDHYGFYMVNAILGTYIHLRSWGGGGIYFEGETDGSPTGNSVFVHPYVLTFCGGSANSYTLKGQRAGINLLQFLRPQVIFRDVPNAFSGLGITPPTNAQYLWRHIGAQSLILRISIYDPNLEGVVFANPVDFGGEGADVIVRPGGYLVGLPDTWDPFFATERLGQWLGLADQATIAAGSGAGVATGGTATFPNGGRDTGVLVRISTGSAPAGAGNLICTVTFAQTASRDYVILQPTTTVGASLLGLFVDNLSSTGFDVYAQEPLDASTTYEFYFSARKTYA